MTKISIYNKDTDVRGNDKWIGSDAQNQNRTKNFTPDNVAAYFNENQVIDLGVDLRYFYDTLDPLQQRVFGSITFETEIGPQVNFSAISTFILSKYTMGHNDVSQFLDFLIGSNVLLSRSNNINMFGYYKIDNIEPYLLDPNFFVVTLTFETGNGYMKEDEDYFISLVQFEQTIPEVPTKTSDLINDGEDGVHPFITAEDVPTPTLQSVTDEGDTTTTAVYLNGGAVVNGFDTTSIVDSSYIVSSNTTTNSSAYIDSTGILSLSADGVNFGSLAVNDITSSVQLQFPDKVAGTYTIATTDDTTLQGVVDNGNTVTGTGGYKSTLDGGDFFVENTILGTKLRITGDGIVYFTNLAGNTTQLSNYGITGSSVNFQFPNKASGPVYTLATTDDILPVTGFVPYTGATDDVDLGAHDLTATQGTFATSGNPDTLTVNHSSGSGKALTITKGGAGEGIYVNKTSGSGNAVTIVGDLQATNLKRTGGTSSQFLKADGSVDSNTYFELPALTSGSVLFSNGTTIAQDNAQLFWDDTNNRLGIGTNVISSLSKVEIAGALGVTQQEVLFALNKRNDLDRAWKFLIGKNADTQWGSYSFRLFSGQSGDLVFGLGGGRLRIGAGFPDTADSTTNFTDRFIIQNNGNVGINTTTDGGYKLHVNGTARVSGTLTVNSNIIIPSGIGFGVFANFFNHNSTPFQFGTNAIFASNNTSAAAATGTKSSYIDGITWAQSSGTADFASFRVSTTINQTGTATGITRGLYINPTLTAAADFRAIEVANGGAYINTTSVQASAILQADSTTQGFLPPRMTTTQKNAIATPAAGLVVYDTDLNQLCTYNGTWGNSPFYQQSLSGVKYFTDFDNTASTTPNFAVFVSGAGAETRRTVGSIPNQSANQIGFSQFQTGTTATGYATMINEGYVGKQFVFGGGTWVFETFINVEILSDATNRFRFVTGFGDHPTNASEGNAAIFTYDEGGTQNGTIASPNWQCVTSVSSVRTLTTTTTAVSVNTWTKLRIEVNAAGTSVTFYINGILVATHTTNIPTFISAANNRGFNVKQSIKKSIGTTNRSVFCDYLLYENNLTTLR
jgi:hypothetical protein